MSTPAPTYDTSSAPLASKHSARRVSPPSWLREPLLHFVLLGGVLFAVDHVVAARSDDPHTIVVGSEVDSEAIEAFEEARGRHPNDKELEALHRVWLDNEVLYREGLAMQLDKGDDAIRERVIFKALSVIDANVKLPPIDEQRLRAWFESHRGKYDVPTRYDFDEAVLAGDSSEGAVRAFVQSLNSDTHGDAQAGLRVFKGRPHDNIVQSYGADFASALEALPPAVWQAVQNGKSWRAIRLGSITAAKPAVFESVRGVVLQDWKDAVASEQRSAAVRALAKKYKIAYESRPE